MVSTVDLNYTGHFSIHYTDGESGAAKRRDSGMGFSPSWFLPPAFLTLGDVLAVVIARMVSRPLAAKKVVAFCGFYLSAIFYFGAVRGIEFEQMSGRGCPTLTGHDAAIYGYGLVVCGTITLVFSLLSVLSYLRRRSKLSLSNRQAFH